MAWQLLLSLTSMITNKCGAFAVVVNVKRVSAKIGDGRFGSVLLTCNPFQNWNSYSFTVKRLTVDDLLKVRFSFSFCFSLWADCNNIFKNYQDSIKNYLNLWITFRWIFSLSRWDQNYLDLLHLTCPFQNVSLPILPECISVLRKLIRNSQ